MPRILVIRAGAVGDFVLTLPVLAVLRQAFPGGRLDVMGIPSIARLAMSGGYAETLLWIDRADLAPFFLNDAPLPSSLVDVFSQYDVIVSYSPDRDGVFAANLARTPVRRVLSGSPIPPEQGRTHVTHHLLQAVSPLGLGGWATAPRLIPSRSDQRRADAFLAAHGGRWQPGGLVAIHPGSGGRWKCWPPERYAVVIDALAGCGIVTLLSSGPADAGTLNELRACLKQATPIIADQLELPVLAAVLTRCRLMMGNDAGITHLAAAVGTPTIGLFGPTDPAVWGPRGRRVTILWGAHTVHDDAGAIQWPPFPSHCPPLAAITVDRILHTIDAMMAAVPNPEPLTPNPGSNLLTRPLDGGL